MILAILFVWFGYKKATANGRNGILWGIIAGASFIGTQILVGLGIGLILGIIAATRGDSIETSIDDNSFLINIVAIIASIGVGYLVLRIADRPLESENNFTTPPTPPKFD
jgi:hypothetical protein